MASSSLRLPVSTAPREYHLELVPTPSSRPELGFECFSGSVSVLVEVIQHTSVLVLHASSAKLHIDSCTFSAARVVSWHCDAAVDQLRVQLETELAPGTFGKLVIAYSGQITTDSVGIYQNSYASGKRKGIGTQLEMMDARRVFPCWDEPQFKATFSLVITVPSFYTVLFNTDVVSTSSLHNGELTRHEFAATPLMSSYLVALFVGEVESLQAVSKNGVLVRVWREVGRVGVGETQLDYAVRSLDFLEDFYGFHYPMKKLDHIGLESFVNGGMENWGLVVYSASSFYVSEDNSFASVLHMIVMIAHETAHMWFGNLVTMRWWNDLWLNEGFATYAGWLAVRHLKPAWDIASLMFVDDLADAFNDDSVKNTHAVEIDPSIDDPVVLDGLFDSISYSKGFFCLMMTARFCGEANFAAGVKAYIAKHKYSNTETSDLYACLSNACGKDVKAFAGAWTSLVGFPVIFVEELGGALSVRQRRFVSDGSSVDTIKPWPLALKVRWGDEEAPTHLVSGLFEASVPRLLGADPNDMVLVDPGCGNMFLTVYSEELWSRILKRIKELPSVDIIGLLHSRLLLCRSGALPSKHFLELCIALDGHPDPRVFVEMFSLLNDEFSPVWLLVAPSQFEALLVRLAESAFISFAERPGEESITCTARSSALSYLVLREGHPMKEEYRKRLDHSSSKAEWATAMRASSWDECHRHFLLQKGVSSEKARMASIAMAVVGPPVDGSDRVEAFIRELGTDLVFSHICSFSNKPWMMNFFKKNLNHICLEVYALTSNPCTRLFKRTYQYGASQEVLDQLEEVVSGMHPRVRAMLEETIVSLRAKIAANMDWLKRDQEQVKAVLQIDQESK